jgi:hypothetical protein
MLGMGNVGSLYAFHVDYTLWSADMLNNASFAAPTISLHSSYDRDPSEIQQYTCPDLILRKRVLVLA